MIKIIYISLMCLLTINNITFAAKTNCGGSNKDLYSKCCKDQECKSSYCEKGRCLTWGDVHVLRDPKWGERACYGNNKPNDSVCCYNKQCKSNWCALGLCSTHAKELEGPKNKCHSNCRW